MGIYIHIFRFDRVNCGCVYARIDTAVVHVDEGLIPVVRHCACGGCIL